MLIMFGAPLLAELRRIATLLTFAWRVSLLYVAFALKMTWRVSQLAASVAALLTRLLLLLLLALAWLPLLLAASIQNKR